MPRLMRKRGRRERGIAMLIVLSALAMLAALVAELQFSSRVDLELAYNARDGLQAEYNALSALRVRALLLKHARRIDSGLQGALGALGVGSGGVPPISQMLEMIPVDCGLLSAITRETEGGSSSSRHSAAGGERGGVSTAGSSARGSSEAASSGDEAQAVFDGECTATSHSEHSKISINVLGNVSSAQKIMPILIAMLSNPKLERHFEEDDRTGTHAESPQELVGAIADWVDQDKNQTGNQVGDEDRFYEYLKDPYQTKNAPFDSLAELQLVHGIDDELYDLLKDKVTIYADNTQIELPTATLPMIIVGLISCMPNPLALGDLGTQQALIELQRLIVELQQLGGGFAVINTGVLSGLVTQAGLGGVIDQNLLKERFTDKSANTWYSIDAEGRVGNASRRIHAVFQAQEGQFYYVRVE